MVPKDTKKAQKWDPWAPKVLQSGAKWDPKGGKSATKKCKKVTLRNPGEPKATKMEPKGTKMEPKGSKIAPRHPKLRFGDQKRLQKYVQRLVLYQKKLGHSVMFFKHLLTKYIRQSTQPGARKTKNSGIPSWFLTVFAAHYQAQHYSTATRIGGTGRKAITISWAISITRLYKNQDSRGSMSWSCKGLG